MNPRKCLHSMLYLDRIVFCNSDDVFEFTPSRTVGGARNVRLAFISCQLVKHRETKERYCMTDFNTSDFYWYLVKYT